MSGSGDWPTSWAGTWAAADGKTITVRAGPRGVAVSVRPGPGVVPYVSAMLLGGGTKTIQNLPACCKIDEQGRRYLQVEAGTDGLGPTYRLYPAVEGPAGLGPADDGVPTKQLVLVPNTSVGLYDEWEDDEGVPWAYPLEPLRWMSSEVS